MLHDTMCQASPRKAANATRIVSAAMLSRIPTPWVIAWVISSAIE
jgi:hypothetical protein